MLQYLLKRIALFIPTLFIISVIIFFLSKKTEHDLIQNKIELQDAKSIQYSPLSEWKRVKIEREKLGFNLPQFYWTIYRKSSSDTIQHIVDQKIKQNLNLLSYSIGNWPAVNAFWKETKEIVSRSEQPEQAAIIEYLQNINNSNYSIRESGPKLKEIESSVQLLRQQKGLINNYLPTFSWNGTNNQYHIWIASFIKGDFGKSFIDGKSVNKKLSAAIKWTIMLSISSILLTLLIAIPTAFYTAFKPESLLSKILDFTFFAFYSMPNFWVATLLIIFLASGDYLSWFPAYGLGYIEEGSSFLEILSIRTSHLILPIITLSYGSVAFIYKQLKSSIRQQLQLDYILTAKAKGLSISNIKWRQLFKNASFPLVTILGGLLPAIISGSFIVEFIFSIPGMGKLSVEAFLSRDFGIVYSVLLISAFLGMLGILISDILYFSLDPRIQFHHSKTNES